MFERMEVAEQVYEGGTPSKIPNRAESSCDGHVRKQKRRRIRLAYQPREEPLWQVQDKQYRPSDR